MSTSKKTDSRSLAASFMEEFDKELIISAVFDHFGFDCIMRCNVNQNELDNSIKTFENSYYKDIDALIKIIELIPQNQISGTKSAEALLEEIKKFVEERCADDISIEEIANSLHISYYYLCHFFKTKSGEALGTFRNKLRIKKAMHLLLNSDKKITEISACCGFNNPSYFTEYFVKLTGVSPSVFKAENKNTPFHDFYTFEEMLLASRLGSIKFLSENQTLVPSSVIEKHNVYEPNDRFSFLHEAAIIEFGGTLYAAWYNCEKTELKGYTPIALSRSYDKGETWTDPEIIAEDKSGKILYCPPIFGIDDNKLYMFINEMVSADHMHALNLYVLSEETNKFEMLWSRPIPFKVNTNVVTLPNGKLMLPGRIAELDGFPNTPAVLISDSGKIDADWRLVKIAENGNLPDGKQYIHPEISVICHENTLYMFNRSDQRKLPLVYISKDFGESWSDVLSHDIPYRNTKIYCGTLTDGRNYIICNTDNFDRSKLVLFLSEANSMRFNKQLVLFDKSDPDMPKINACHYPSAYESDGILYVIASKNYTLSIRGAELFKINLKDI